MSMLLHGLCTLTLILCMTNINQLNLDPLLLVSKIL